MLICHYMEFKNLQTILGRNKGFHYFCQLASKLKQFFREILQNTDDYNIEVPQILCSIKQMKT